MCGIAGVLYADPGRPVDPLVLRDMADAMSHRGPDADGFWIEPGLGLAHRRLSIIDVAGGDQPIGNEDGSIQVVFNGEIYNSPQLRRDLEGRGHRFRTRTDTEVLVHLYEERAESLVESLRGMFAFALWDHRRRRLLLARDRVGIKPLYVRRDRETLLFASELKPILAYPGIDMDVDPAAVEEYLTFGMIPGERSIFRGVRKLPPAHVLTVDADRLDAPPRRYWQLDFAPDDSRGVDDWREALDAKITETVRAHRLADVPIGAFLSGGLDSGVVVAALAADGAAGLRTFSIGFREDRYSELPYAREVARRFGTEHVEEVVTAADAANLDDLVRFYDEPFADSSAIPTLCVSRLAARHVKVVLSGDGGDEAFGGYARYQHDLREGRLRDALPRWLRRSVLRSAARLWPRADWLPRPLRARTTLENLTLDPAPAYANTVSLCRGPLRRALLAPGVRGDLGGGRPERIIERPFALGGGDPLAGMLAADTAVLLPDDFLTKVDRASMACGLEVRPPLVDHELLELAARIPSRFKIRDGRTKWIFRELYGHRLPAKVATRPKQGFEIPVDDWLRGPLSEQFVETVLSPLSPIREWIDQRAAARLHQAHQRRLGRHGTVLWALLVFGHWAAAYLAPRAPGRRRRDAGVVHAP